MYSHRLNKCAFNISNITAVGGRYISFEKYTFMDEIRAGYEKALKKYGFETVVSEALEAYCDAPKGVVIAEKIINEVSNQ